MKNLLKLKPYFDQFGEKGFDEFLYNCSLTHGSNLNPLQENLEFSLAIDECDPLSLRYGLFKVKSIEGLKERMKRYGLPNLSSFNREIPEFALGIDSSINSKRDKLYFLRLPNLGEFRKNPQEQTIKLANKFGFSGKLWKNLDNCYLLGVDFSKGNEPNFKFYTRDEEFDYKMVKDKLNFNGIDSQYLPLFEKYLPRDKLIDLTTSYKHNGKTGGLEAISIFLEPKPNMNEEVKKVIQESFPGRYKEFIEATNKLKKDFSIIYSQVGIVKPFGDKHEKVNVYFSPKEK